MYTHIHVVTLLGAHTIGHVHPNLSGFGHSPSSATSAGGSSESADAVNAVNAWDRTPLVFDNEYYKNIIDIAWASNPNFRLNSAVSDQSNVLWFNFFDPSIMLNIDMSLGYDISFEEGGLTMLANDVDLFVGGQLCGPINQAAMDANQPVMINNPNTGGPVMFGFFSQADSSDTSRACASNGDSVGSESTIIIGKESQTYALTFQYANDNAFFINSFQNAFARMISLGYGENGKFGKSLSEICPSGL